MDTIRIVTLVDGATSVGIDAVWSFFETIPAGDRTFFKEPVEGPGTISGWMFDDRASRFLAVDGDRVIGYLAVIPGIGWSSHVGELRLVVDPTVRRAGLGHRLARHGLAAALRLGLAKVVVEVVSTQESTIGLFTGLGFRAEALLEDHVRDSAGDFADLLVLANRVDDSWTTMAQVGLDAVLD